MSSLILFAIMVYAGWRALVNYIEFSEAHKKYGAFIPRELPDYGTRCWLWGAVAAFIAISLGIPIFGGGGSRYG